MISTYIKRIERTNKIPPPGNEFITPRYFGLRKNLYKPDETIFTGFLPINHEIADVNQMAGVPFPRSRNDKKVMK